MERYDKSICCAFSGHRPVKLPWGLNESDARCIALKAEIEARLEGIYETGYRVFFCGMALGCDMYFAEAVLKLREEHPDVKLIAVIPCGSQPDKWTAAQRQRYNDILLCADDSRLISVNYTPECMQERNRYMVDNSSLLLCCYNGHPGGGTMSTILYAQRNGADVIIIDI